MREWWVSIGNKIKQIKVVLSAKICIHQSHQAFIDGPQVYQSVS